MIFIAVLLLPALHFIIFATKLFFMEKSYNSVKEPIFSKSELKVADLLARGYSEKEIAEKLHISKYTVNNHMRNIRERNGLTKNTEVILLYIAYLRNNKFSLKAVREFGLGILLVFINVCQFTH